MGVGFCNIDKLQLEVMTMSKDPKEKQMAQTIHEVVSNHHLWLTTLLVYNAVALESLPLVIHTLMPDWMAILFSTFIVLIAAEIVPQAVCTGPKKMMIAYWAAPIVNTMRRALFFIIYPIAKGLDSLLGVHSHQRIQHKDFANFLTGNVNFCIN
jgi:metal transporter CNNM